jgi:hypothetical protein
MSAVVSSLEVTEVEPERTSNKDMGQSDFCHYQQLLPEVGCYMS